MKNKKMKLARVECDLTQEQLAEKIGVTRQTIGLIESGNYYYRVHVEKRLDGLGQQKA